MGIFGMMDAANVPSNPFKIDEGEYTGEITAAKIKPSRDGVRQLIIDYIITNEESQFKDSKVSKYFDLVDPDLTAEAVALLPAEEQRKIRRNLSSLKNALCGNGRNKGLGQDVDDLDAPDWDPEALVGLKVDLAISNYGPTNDGVNLRWANIQE